MSNLSVVIEIISSTQMQHSIGIPFQSLAQGYAWSPTHSVILVNDIILFEWNSPVHGVTMRIMETPNIFANYENGFISGDPTSSGN